MKNISVTTQRSEHRHKEGFRMFMQKNVYSHMVVSWVVGSCSISAVCHRFGQTYCLHLQGRTRSSVTSIHPLWTESWVKPRADVAWWQTGRSLSLSVIGPRSSSQSQHEQGYYQCNKILLVTQVHISILPLTIGGCTEMRMLISERHCTVIYHLL
jgi:hypothetical protein